MWHSDLNRKFNKNSGIRLHLGCERRSLKGYLNIDLWLTDATVKDCIKIQYYENGDIVTNTDD